MEINNVEREVLRNNYRSRNLIGHYHFWGISPRNSTSFTRPFLAGRRARAGHKTSAAGWEVGATGSAAGWEVEAAGSAAGLGVEAAGSDERV